MKRICTVLLVMVFVFASAFPSYVQAAESTKDTSNTSGRTSNDLYHDAIKSKESCQAKVLTIKDLYKKESKEYRNASNLYNDAMAKYNSLFEIAKLTIQSGTSLDVNKHEKDFSDADSAGKAFLQYADNIVGPGYGFAPVVAVTLVPLFDFIFKSTRDAADVASKKDTLRKQELSSYMDSLKWKSFQDIGATK